MGFPEQKSSKEEKGKSAAVYNLQQRILGKKNSPLEAIAVEDPSSGIIVDEPERIKEISLKYCADLLKNREPAPGYEEVVEAKVKLHEERMLEQVENDMDNLTREQFDKALRTVERKHKNKYKFILNGGISLKNALFSLFCSVWKNETIPEVWYNSLLVQIYKGKGSPNNLDNIRHIHLKEEVPKLFSQIVTMAAKDNRVANMSKSFSSLA